MAKQVSLFKVLRRELGPRIAGRGYAEAPEATSNYLLAYFRDASRPPSLGFWFQRDVKAYYVDAFGSSFTLEYFRSLANPFDMGHRKRAYFLLTPGELEEMRRLQNTMIGRLPRIESVLTPWQMELLGDSAEEQSRPRREPFNPLHDVWMRYRDEEDLLGWTTFLGELLPALEQRFDAAKPPP